MIKFFRHLRHQFLKENNISKYLLYAIGEILLVVIGILIALQINTWNEERILRKKEQVYLHEIRTNLQDDFANIKYSLDFNSKKDSTIAACLNTILLAKSDGEAMLAINSNMPLLAQFSVFTQNRVAFDNMLSSENIGIISADTLRNMLSAYYANRSLLEGTQERVKELTRNFVDNITPKLMNRENIRQFFKVESEFASGNDQDFKTDQVLFGDLFGMQRNLESHSQFLWEYQQNIERLIEQIDLFLIRKE
jgi:hypothetical protein